MGAHQHPPPDINELDTSIQVAGSFYIKNHHYLVISASYNDKPFIKSDLNSFSLLSTMLEVGQLEIDGQHYAIVEAESGTSIHPCDSTSLLTERELQIVKFVALGYPNKQIAKHLQISEWTVSTHLRRVFAKLGVDSRAAMVYRCASLMNDPNP